ncbi:hypothetical protein D7Y41_33715 [Anaerotruncus sp. 1XD22-93]|nr:hypothetical protein D7Y41_33715 [Anaerotruncus sp. 1XD22-93]
MVSSGRATIVEPPPEEPLSPLEEPLPPDEEPPPLPEPPEFPFPPPEEPPPVCLVTLTVQVATALLCWTSPP